MAVCCQNLSLGALSSRRAPSVLVGALFKKLGLFLYTPRISSYKRNDGVKLSNYMEQIKVTFHTLTTATTKIILFWNVTPLIRLGIYQGVKKNCCFLPHHLFRIYETLATVQQVFFLNVYKYLRRRCNP
jgi:hypothetical protein